MKVSELTMFPHNSVQLKHGECIWWYLSSLSWEIPYRSAKFLSLFSEKYLSLQ